MLLQLPRIVIADQIEVIETRHDAVIHDLDDVGFLQVFRHPAHGSAVFCKRGLTVSLAIAFHHFGQIKIDLVASPILHEREPIAVADLSSNGRNTHSRLRTAADARRPIRAASDLDPPKPQAKRGQADEHEQSQELEPQNWA